MKKQFTAVLLLWGIYTQAQIGIGTTSPNSTLDVRGSLSLKYTSFSANTTAGSSDNTLVFTGTSAATLTLPDATTCQGRVYWIKTTSSNSSTLTIATTSSQTIDGLASWALTQLNKVAAITSNGTNWIVASESLPGNSTSWIHGGNNVSSQQNIGTTSNYHLPFITNNTEKMRLTSTGNLGIGSSAFNATYPERLLVDGGSTGNTNYQNVIVGKGNTDSYAQLNIQNSSAGTGASSDVVATSNNGTESVNYIDMGINGGGNTSTGVLGGANKAYLYSTGNDFAIGNSTDLKNLNFFTNAGGTNTERMRITSTGNVGIGTASPAAALHVVKSNSGGNVLTLQNTSATGYSSADFYSSSNVLSGTFGYGNASTGAPFTGRNYFNTYGNDFILANGASSPFFVQGSTNNVGVNTTTPTEKLDVTGNIRFSGALMPNNTAGTAGTFLMSMGSGAAPTWFDASNLAWQVNGNSVPSIKTLGTTNAYDLPFITNNTEKMRITSAGTVGIGSSTFNGTNPEELLVDAGSRTDSIFQNVIVGKGNTNSYAQLNIQNSFAGSKASADVVATADNGNESSNYIDMGINSGSNNTTGVLGGANTAYIYSTGTNFSIGNAQNARDILFFTTTSSVTAERMRLTSTGILQPAASNTYDLGTSTLRWRTIYSNNVLNTSDARLKTNIRTLNYGLSAVLNMHPVQYNWKEGNDPDKKIGFLAQELRKVIPEVVIGDENKETLAVNYTELIPVLVNAIKEQQKQIDDLKKKMEKLQRK